VSGIRSKQLNIDEPLDCQGQTLFNVGGLVFADPAVGDPPPTLGTEDNDVLLLIAASESADTRQRSLVFDGNARLTGLTEKDGLDVIKDKSYALDALGRVGQRTVLIGGKAIEDTFIYVGNTLEIQSVSRGVS